MPYRMNENRVPNETPDPARPGSGTGTEPPLRVLYFAPKACWPPDTGAKLRNYYLARELARKSQLTYLGFADDNPALAVSGQQGDIASPRADSGSAAPGPPGVCGGSALMDIGRVCEQVVTVPRDRAYTLVKAIRGALGPLPLPVLNYATPAMEKELARLLETRAFGAVQVESLHLASYLPLLRTAQPRPFLLCDWHNVESEVMLRYSQRAARVSRRLYARLTARRMVDLERRSMGNFDAHLVVSNRDRDRLLELAPEAHVFVIENGVDVGHFSDEAIARAHADWHPRVDEWAAPPQETEIRGGPSEPCRRILFVGSMDYHANVDGVVHFARTVWPAIHQEKPGLSFTIVGRNPAAEVRALAGLPGIEVTGRVDDVRPYYHEAMAAVIPLRVGGGSRLKIVEAMAAGVPVISTRLGAEGLAVRDGTDILLAHTTGEWVHALSVVLDRESRRRTLVASARALVRARYDWSSIGSTLLDVYAELSQAGTSASLPTAGLKSTAAAA
jgi:polysaccharide biosynthesis protein PslH